MQHLTFLSCRLPSNHLFLILTVMCSRTFVFKMHIEKEFRHLQMASQECETADGFVGCEVDVRYLWETGEMELREREISRSKKNVWEQWLRWENMSKTLTRIHVSFLIFAFSLLILINPTSIHQDIIEYHPIFLLTDLPTDSLSASLSFPEMTMLVLLSLSFKLLDFWLQEWGDGMNNEKDIGRNEMKGMVVGNRCL